MNRNHSTGYVGGHLRRTDAIENHQKSDFKNKIRHFSKGSRNLKIGLELLRHYKLVSLR